MGVNEVALCLTLGIAAFTDSLKHKIYNKLLVPAFLFALLFNTFQRGSSGLKHSLLGAAVGFALLLLPYLMGGMGAGDVKLLTVIGAFGGVSFVLTSFLYGAIIGGLISAYLLVRRKALVDTLKHFFLFSLVHKKTLQFSESINNTRQEKFPYGIAIVIGTLITLAFSSGGGGL